MITKRSIYFYNLGIKTKPLSTYVSPKTILYTILKTHDNKVSTEDGYEIDVLKNNNEGVFASYGLKKEAKLSMLTREREPESNNILYPSEQSPRIIEKFTYFYINYEHSAMAILKNNYAPSPQDYIKKFITSNIHLISTINESFIFHKIDINEMLIPDIKTKIKKLNKACELKFEFIQKVSPSYMPGVEEIYNEYEGDLDKISMTLKFKSNTKIRQLKEHLANISKEQDNIKSLKLTGLFSDSDAEEVIDLIKRTLTRHVEIELNSVAPRSKEENDIIEQTIYETMKNNLLTQVVYSSDMQF